MSIFGLNEYKRGRDDSGSHVRYQYTAKNLEGKIFRGTAMASNYDALYRQLRGQGLYLQNATLVEEKRGKKFTDKELSVFCQELSNLLGAGVNLVRALTILTREDLPQRQIMVYENILNEVRAGTSLSAAMERQEVFPDLMLGMIRSAEGNGNLDGVAAQLASHYTREHRIKQQIRSAMTYPCILAVLALLALTAIFTFILPEFEDLFDGMETLPAFTVVLMAVSDFLVSRWYVALGGIVLVAVLVRILLCVPALCLRVDKWKIKTRFLGIGKLTSAMCTARFARTICSLYSCGMPLVAALQTARGTVGNRYLANQFDGVAAKVCGGETLSGSLMGVDGLQRKLCGAVQVGEETGRLDNMLSFIADVIEYDSGEASKRLLTFLEPMMILVMSLVVGVIMIGVMYPIISSYGAIGGIGY